MRFKNGFILSTETLCKEKNIITFDFSFNCYDFFCEVFWEYNSYHKNIRFWIKNFYIELNM